MKYDLDFILTDVIMVLLIIALFIGFILSVCDYTKEKECNDKIYNLLMQNELEFIDNFTIRNEIYNIVYKENGEIKKVKVTFEQYYNIIEKYKKTIDNQ